MKKIASQNLIDASWTFDASEHCRKYTSLSLSLFSHTESLSLSDEINNSRRAGEIEFSLSLSLHYFSRSFSLLPTEISYLVDFEVIIRPL